MERLIQSILKRSENLLKVRDTGQLYLFFQKEYQFCKNFRPIVEKLNSSGAENIKIPTIRPTGREEETKKLAGELLIYHLSREAGIDEYYWSISTVQNYLFMKCEFKAIRSFLRSKDNKETRSTLVDCLILAQTYKRLRVPTSKEVAIENSKLRRLRQYNKNLPKNVGDTLRDTLATEIEEYLSRMIKEELLIKLKYAIEQCQY